MTPQLWNSHVTRVQRRVVWIQASPGWRVINEPMAKANGMEKPTYPRYSIGGWIAMAGYCRRGLRPLPSGTATISLSVASIWKGLAMKLLRTRKNVWMAPITPRTHGMKSRWRRRLVKATTAAEVERRQLQKRREPSCPPHHAANLYRIGMVLLEWAAT